MRKLLKPIISHIARSMKKENTQIVVTDREGQTQYVNYYYFIFYDQS
jgi:hypothetical protein